MKKLIHWTAARSMGKMFLLFFDSFPGAFLPSCSTWLWNGFLFIVGPHILVEVFLYTFFHMDGGGNWYSHQLLQILGDAVTLWLNGSYPDTPSSVAGGRQAGRRRRPKWWNEQTPRPPEWVASLSQKNVYFFIFLVFVSKRKANSTWILKLNLEMKTRMKGKMLCNYFFSLMWML